MFNLPIPPLPIPGMGFTAPIGVPVGTVVAFAGKVESSPSNSPSNFATNLEALGWMLCEDRELKVSEYPELFAVLGYLYGGAGDVFKIPDYRGYFLRGVNGRSNNDPDVLKRTPAKGGTAKDVGVGSQQDDALQTHQHQYNKSENPTPVSKTPTPSPDAGSVSTPDLTGEPTSLNIGKDAVRTSTETRPKNVAVNYIIKYTNCL